MGGRGADYRQLLVRAAMRLLPAGLSQRLPDPLGEGEALAAGNPLEATKLGVNHHDLQGLTHVGNMKESHLDTNLAPFIPLWPRAGPPPASSPPGPPRRPGEPRPSADAHG